jgi:hypothetical protein
MTRNLIRLTERFSFNYDSLEIQGKQKDHHGNGKEDQQPIDGPLHFLILSLIIQRIGKCFTFVMIYRLVQVLDEILRSIWEEIMSQLGLFRGSLCDNVIVFLVDLMLELFQEKKQASHKAHDYEDGKYFFYGIAVKSFAQNRFLGQFPLQLL